MTVTQTRTERIHAAFDRARTEGRAAFIPFLTAGYPNAAGFHAVARALLDRADLMEVGLPYSDPLGDGPVIQRASEQVLREGSSTLRTFEYVRALRAESSTPILLMTYINPVYAVGPERFMRLAVEAGVDGLILPDLPPDQDEEIQALARQAGLALTFLIAPTSTPERVALVTRACTGFVYAVSVTGVTGAREGSALGEVPALVALARQHTSLPVAVGFGVKDAATARAVAVDAGADGVVVGSAFIQAIERGEDAAALADAIRSGTRK
ncbi:tryptophan synthase subunit alpha [Deinococcus maricopensis]|uniref:Tryptophan synthase alpha chain n=1 Tax=Deinococcus maricopensis (strain DSM 21211 / LMG 22137 / NRRL B-23946 / LB-34) TaxID=709986 RepID=E8U8V8_DEIML|nr:tryptophan synthase subunit alpha [Deinococcus maricopensis]ADV67497.1 Tryptophan synthase alpha chain [Deinococcus maricopensis DSM 21211]